MLSALSENQDLLGRSEIVLLEDDPATRELLYKELKRRGIDVHAFARGEDALEEIKTNAGIGALLTDIEILDQFPNGAISGLQGYDVANRIPSEAGGRILSIIVMTRLPTGAAFDSLNSFKTRISTVHKDKWFLSDTEPQRDRAFDEVAALVRREIEQTPYAFYSHVMREHENSVWITQDYWSTYRSMWFSPDWPNTEAAIARRASEIVSAYDRGDVRKLKGEWLTFAKRPTPAQLVNHLVGRRVIYGLRLLEPEDWSRLIYGERVVLESRQISAKARQEIRAETVRALLNQLNRRMDDHKLWELDAKWYELTEAEQAFLREQRRAAKPVVDQLFAALADESQEVRKEIAAYMAFWDVSVGKYGMTLERGDERESQNTKQTLMLLGIRKEDITPDNPADWKLVLPEERVWLAQLRGR